MLLSRVVGLSALMTACLVEAAHAAEGSLMVIRPGRSDFFATGPTPDEIRLQTGHEDFLRAIADRGSLALAGRTLTNDERTFGILLFPTLTPGEVESLMQQDPAVRSGMFRYEIAPFRPFTGAWMPEGQPDAREKNERGDESGSTQSARTDVEP